MTKIILLKNILKMKNIVGQTPRGEDFFPRDKIIERIYRRIESNSDLFLSAPRRAGKTSIMRFLEDNPKEGYAFVYLTVEDADDTEQYFKILSEELINNPIVGNLVKARDKAKSIFAAFADNIKKIKIASFEIETQKVATKYSEEFEKLVRNLDTEGSKIILMIDEFPVALEAIAKKSGVDAGVHFLHLNRNIRQVANKNIVFIYTGSIGLPNVTRRMNATATVNDLNVLEVPPLTKEEGEALVRTLFKTYNVHFEEEIVDFILQRLNWLMPFFIQLVVQMLIDDYESEAKPLTKLDVNRVLDKASNHRNNIYFDSYYSRLDKTLPNEESTIAKLILSDIAVNNAVSKEIIDKKHQNVLEVLEYDGYISLSKDGFYRFNSPILQLWWRKYATQ
jgi:uncharacterized protein